MSDEINVTRYIGHNYSEGYLSIKNGLIIFEPKDFVWESLRFQISISHIQAIELLDVLLCPSYEEQNLYSKAINIYTKTYSQYIIGAKDIKSILSLLKLVLEKQNKKAS